MKVTLSVKRNGNQNITDALQRGAFLGMSIGGEVMAQAVSASANDLARYPTGELESTITYDPLGEGEVITGRVVAGTDHAEPFAFGADAHFVPYEEADERIKAGLYTHIKPVYDESKMPIGGAAPRDSWKSNVIAGEDDRIPVGYLVSSSAHPFMEQGFNATKDTLVQEVANRIAEALEMNS